jgi:hypothetical protein
MNPQYEFVRQQQEGWAYTCLLRAKLGHLKAPYSAANPQEAKTIQDMEKLRYIKALPAGGYGLTQTGMDNLTYLQKKMEEYRKATGSIYGSVTLPTSNKDKTL